MVKAKTESERDSEMEERKKVMLSKEDIRQYYYSACGSTCQHIFVQRYVECERGSVRASRAKFRRETKSYLQET